DSGGKEDAHAGVRVFVLRSGTSEVRGAKERGSAAHGGGGSAAGATARAGGCGGHRTDRHAGSGTTARAHRYPGHSLRFWGGRFASSLVAGTRVLAGADCARARAAGVAG